MADSPGVLLAAASLLVSAAALLLQVRWRARWRRLLQIDGAAGLADLVRAQSEELSRLRAALEAVRGRCDAVDARLGDCVRTPGVVRYNAYEDTGADLSFSLALADSEGNGVVLSSLFGRDGGRVFAKPLTGGASQYKLSAEEQEAIQRAWTR